MIKDTQFSPSGSYSYGKMLPSPRQFSTGVRKWLHHRKNPVWTTVILYWQAQPIWTCKGECSSYRYTCTNMNSNAHMHARAHTYQAPHCRRYYCPHSQMDAPPPSHCRRVNSSNRKNPLNADTLVEDPPPTTTEEVSVWCGEGSGTQTANPRHRLTVRPVQNLFQGPQEMVANCNAKSGEFLIKTN